MIGSRALLMALAGLAIVAIGVDPAHADRPRSPRPAAFAAAPVRSQPRAAHAIVVDSEVSCGGHRDAALPPGPGSQPSADVRVLVPVGRSHAMVSRLWGTQVRDGDASITLGMASSGMRYRVAGSVWIEVGLGVAHTSVDRDDEIDVAGLTAVTPAAVAATSAELGEWRGVDFDVEVKAGSSLYRGALPAQDAMGLLRARW